MNEVENGQDQHAFLRISSLCVGQQAHKQVLLVLPQGPRSSRYQDTDGKCFSGRD